MLWFTVWLVLLLLTLLGAFLLGRRLSRSGKGLVAELERASAVADLLEKRRAELAERYPTPTPPRPDLDAGPVEKARFLGMRHEHLAGIRRRRRARLARAARHWRSIGSPL